MVKLVTEKKEIEKIINDKIKGRKLIFTSYYYLGIDKKGISHDKVLNIFQNFEKVSFIEIKSLKYRDIGYELFYKIDEDITFSIATCPRNESILLIHAIEYKRDLKKRLKKQ